MKSSLKLTKETVDPFFSNWAQLSEEIAHLHGLRDKQLSQYMQEGIELYKKLISHCEDQIVPMNGQERLQFVDQHLGNYAAYRQLDELFSEMKKKIASKRIQFKKMEYE